MNLKIAAISFHACPLSTLPWWCIQGVFKISGNITSRMRSTKIKKTSPFSASDLKTVIKDIKSAAFDAVLVRL